MIEEGLHDEIMEGCVPIELYEWDVMYSQRKMLSQLVILSIKIFIFYFFKALQQGVKKHCQMSEFRACVSGLKH